MPGSWISERWHIVNSMNRLQKASLILSIIGLLDSLYLSWIEYSGKFALCGPIGNCESVNTSKYAQVYGIPLAYIGVIIYTIFIFMLILEGKNDWLAEYGTLIMFGLTLIGVLFSIYLTYLEIWVIKAICPYCVVSAIVMVILFVLSSIRLFRMQS
jgi:uncharacterized membrane protein